MSTQRISSGERALHGAAGNGSEAVARLLLENGANAEEKDALGWTALHWAVTNEHEAVIRLLSKKGLILMPKMATDRQHYT